MTSLDDLFAMLFGADIASSVPSKRRAQMNDEVISTVEATRNSILCRMADLNFQDALSEVEEQLKKENVNQSKFQIHDIGWRFPLT